MPRLATLAFLSLAAGFASEVEANDDVVAPQGGGDAYVFQMSENGTVESYASDANGVLYPVDLSDPAFQKALASGIYAEVDLPIGERGVTAGGMVRGSAEDGTLSFDAGLDLLDDFEYSTGPVSTTLEGGERVSVVVEAGKFRGADLSGVAVETEVAIDDGSLRLAGSIDGRVSPDYRVSLLGSLTIMDDFVYEKGPVSTTLEPGGQVRIRVRRDVFRRLRMADVKLDAFLEVPGTQGLAVEGSVSGSYRNGSLDLKGSLRLDEPFSYEKKGGKRTLESGPARLRLREGRRAWIMVAQPGHGALVLDLDDGDDEKGEE